MAARRGCGWKGEGWASEWVDWGWRWGEGCVVALARHSFEALAKGAMMSECGIAGILAATTRRRRFRARPPRITRCRWRAEHAYHSLSAARTLTPRERPGEQGRREAEAVGEAGPGF